MMKQTTPYQATVVATATPPTITLSAPTTQNKNRCACCSKKLTLADFACGKCQVRHCGAHRLPEAHTCNHDFRAAGREQLTQQLVRVIGDKIEHI
jgi:predicted nucleic acid binding AN1-type Zn finger protein